MSDCLHCDIHELLDSELEGKEANLAEIAAKVTEVLADIILMAPPDDQSTLMADILATSAVFCLRRKKTPIQLSRDVQAISGSRTMLVCFHFVVLDRRTYNPMSALT